MAPIDWDAGEYEQISPELAPVAEDVVARADPGPGDELLGIACGDGNAALLAAHRGARVTGVDGAPRLVEVAADRARAQGLDGTRFLVGDLLALPLPDACADVVVSVFGLIFASDPGAGLAQAARVLRPGGRLLFSAWIPEGPVSAMMRAFGAVATRATGASAPPPPLAWFDPDAVGRVARSAGLTLDASHPGSLEIRDASPEAYQARGERAHPAARAAMGAIERAGLTGELRSSMIEALRAGNEDPGALLLHSPYVVHDLRRD